MIFRSLHTTLLCLIFLGTANASPLTQLLEREQISVVPKKIGQGKFSTSAIEYNTTFNKDESLMLFGTANADWSKSRIQQIEIKGGELQEVAPFEIGGHYFNGSDAHISADGKKVYWSMTIGGQNQKRANLNLWVADFNGSLATNPRPLSNEINTPFPQSYPTTNLAGDLYFGSFIPEKSSEIFKRSAEGKISSISELNTPLFEGDFFIDPNNQFAIFVGMNWAEGLGVSDLYISFLKENTWSNPINLGVTINSKGVDGSPYVTRDKNYLIFTSNRDSNNVNQFDGHLDIWAVKINIESYRKKANW